ncbi:unnamed protein product [Euphydryas editha]|uniref:Uncharacterized protein n=1 Tax=Euphydryas editha TaxID=104508 RepID=A0AAU9TUC8_EUPED|nr:unnamed protein product [Euphydryas editha]
MSASQWLSSLASADGLLTDNECSMLLEVDLFNSEGGIAYDLDLVFVFELRLCYTKHDSPVLSFMITALSL